MDVLFVGGTGRSGTHVVSKLVGRLSRYEKIGNEVRFHCDPGGFPDLLSGAVTLDEFVSRLRGTWWRRVQTLQVRGLHRTVPRKRFESAVEGFEASFEDARETACRDLFFALLGPIAERADKPGLVEMSCDTVAEGPALLRIFPGAMFIHSVRDGRDAASSRVSKGKGVVFPRNPEQGIEWWEARLRRIDAAVREIPADRVTAVSLDELVYGDRESSYRGLLEFLGTEDELEMRSYFETKMSAEAAHRDRWREGLSEDDQEQYARRYAEALERLERDGVHCAELLRTTLERTAPVREASGVAVTGAGASGGAAPEPAAALADAPPEPAPGDLAFLAGPGRARRGAQMVAQLLGSGSRYAVVPVDARFHCDTDGLSDLIEGRVSLKRFLLKLREIWWGEARAAAAAASTRSSPRSASRRRRGGSRRATWGTRWGLHGGCSWICCGRSRRPRAGTGSSRRAPATCTRRRCWRGCSRRRGSSTSSGTDGSRRSGWRRPTGAPTTRCRESTGGRIGSAPWTARCEARRMG